MKESCSDLWKHVIILGNILENDRMGLSASQQIRNVCLAVKW
jgi:hypothetical protein